MPVNTQNVDTVFQYQPPKQEDVAKYIAIRDSGRVLAHVILDNTPVCADQQAALRLLREAVMTANAALALNGIV
jgi:hypothetical protein